MKSLLLVSRCSPWSGLAARETLDLALAGGAFDLPVSLLWRDDGVYQLLQDQQPALLEQKNLQAQLSGLPLFGVESLYVCQASLAQRGIGLQQLALDVQPLATGKIADLVRCSGQVLVF